MTEQNSFQKNKSNSLKIIESSFPKKFPNETLELTKTKSLFPEKFPKKTLTLMNTMYSFPEYDGKTDIKLYIKNINRILYNDKKVNYNNLLKFLNIMFNTNFRYLHQFKFIPTMRLINDKEKIESALNLFSEYKKEFGKKKIINIIRYVVKKSGFHLKIMQINNVNVMFIK